MTHIAKWSIPLLVLLTAALFSREPTPEKNNERPVKVVLAKPASITKSTQSRTFAGILRPTQSAMLSFTTSGRVLERAVNVGDRVTPGQVVARLDQRGYENAQATAQATLLDLETQRDQMARDLDRVQRLMQANAATDEERERLRARLNSLNAACRAAKSRLDEATRVLEETILKAPFAGIVSEVAVEAGEFASPGRAVVYLSGSNALELEIEVPESIISRLQMGREVEIRFPLANREHASGRITSIGFASRGKGQLFPIIIDLPAGEGLIPGMTAELNLKVDTEAMTAVPLSAIIDPSSGRPAIFCVREGVVEKVLVKLGNLVGESVTIEGAINPGEWVVTGGQASLFVGDKVEVRQ